MAVSSPSLPVVLTGANGFIGRRVLEALLTRGFEVWAVTRKPISGRAGLARTFREIVVSDWCNLAHLPDVPAFALVHCAWCPPYRKQAEPHSEQVRIMAKLLDLYRGKIARVVALGSAEEYGQQEGCLDEDNMPGEPVSSYAWGKQALASLLRWWCLSQGAPVIWLRPFTVYGEDQKGDMAIPFAIRQALGKQVAHFSAAIQSRDFIHVNDVAGGIVESVTANLDGFNAINLGTGIPTELRQVLQRISACFHAEELFKYGVLPMRPNEPKVQYADVTRAKRLLNWSPAVVWEAGIARVCDYHLEKI